MSSTPLIIHDTGMTVPKSKVISHFEMGNVFSPNMLPPHMDNDEWAAGINIHYVDGHTHWNGIHIYAGTQEEVTRLRERLMVLIVADVGVFNIA